MESAVDSVSDGLSATAKVLVVDDNPDKRYLLSCILERHFHVIEADNGRKALTMIEEVQPDVVLLDVLMPELDGFEFLQELRKQPAFVDIPVIVVTAKDLTAEDYRILSGQTERIIAKDQGYLNELTVAVRARLAQHPTREAERLPH